MKVVEVVVEVAPKVVRGCAEGDGSCAEGCFDGGGVCSAGGFRSSLRQTAPRRFTSLVHSMCSERVNNSPPFEINGRASRNSG